MATRQDALTFATSPDSALRLKDLFRSFDSDPQSLQKFLDDPTGTTVREVFGSSLPEMTPDSVSEANRLLLSAMSNPGFKAWMNDYQKKTVE